VQRLRASGQTVFALVFSEQRHELVILTDDGNVLVSLFRSSRLGAPRVIGTDAGVALALSPDGQTVSIQRGNPGPVVIVDLADGKTMTSLPTLPWAHRFAFDATGRNIAVGVDGSVQLFEFDAQGGQPRRGASLPVAARPTDVRFHDGEVLVADTDGAITIWDAATGENRGGVSLLATSPGADLSGGRPMAAVLTTAGVVLRDLRTAAIRRSACAVFGRALTTRERARFDVRSTANPCSTP
jgi:WD40 repeat protein